MKHFINSVLAFLGLLLAFGVQAQTTIQQQVPVQVAPAQRQAPAVQIDPTLRSQLESAAVQVAQVIDQGRAGEIWDGMLPAVQKRETKATFVRNTNALRARLGALQGRALVGSEIGVVPPGSNVVPGTYVIVSLNANFQNKQNTREIVAFSQDERGLWRVTGYQIR